MVSMEREEDTGHELNEPTIGEKLQSLAVLDDVEQQQPPSTLKPPSADSLHILLKQALHADDRALLLDCLYTQDEKVIENSTSLLNLPDALKLLQFLLSIVQSRGAVLACALPWIRSLLLQHASGIMSQESSMQALNSLYQLIESRVSTFMPAVQLSSCLDLFYAGVIDDDTEEIGAVTPIIFEDNDSDSEKSESVMETDKESEEPEALNGVSAIGDSDDGMTD